MCGIVGVYSFHSAPLPSRQVFDKALELMKHRGPDACDVFIDDNRVGIGHVRLAIIDLSPESNQPFHYGDYCIVFNGEIYNYLEIKSELKEKGYTFRTASDTEVIVASYQEWQQDCLSRFNGMWAFALYNKVDKSLFMARDRFGIKPLYYHTDAEALYFGSTIKSLLALKPDLRKPNLSAIAAYCRESVGGESPETWFSGVLRLAPAHYISISQGEIRTVRYWDYPTGPGRDVPFPEAVATYTKLFEDATRLRMRSDVPVGATLSSGLDSQSIVAMAQRCIGRPLYTYTASFPEQPYDEYKTVEALQNRQGYRSHRQIVAYDHFLPDLHELIYHLEGGHSSPSIFPLSQVLKRAKQDIVVFLEGQGADELLGGYINAVFFDYLIDTLKAKKFKTAWKALLSFRNDWSLPYAGLLYLRTSLPSYLRTVGRKVQGIEKIYGPSLKKYKSPTIARKYADSLKQKLYEQHTGGLVNLLHYGDNISMMHSLESRLPFMDYRLVEYVFSLPSDFLIRNGMGKYLHREAMKGLVPETITADRIKIGFKSPFETVFQDPELVSFLIHHPVVAQENWFDPKAVNQLIRKVSENKIKQHRLLFRILCVTIWYDTFIQPEHFNPSRYEKPSTNSLPSE